MASMQKSADGYASETVRQLGVLCDDLGSMGARSGKGQGSKVSSSDGVGGNGEAASRLSSGRGSEVGSSNDKGGNGDLNLRSVG